MSRTTHPGWNSPQAVSRYMQRAGRAAPMEPQSYLWVWILGGLVLAGGLAAVIAAMSSPTRVGRNDSSINPGEAGFSVLNCSVTVLDEGKAMAFSLAKGKLADDFGIATPDAPGYAIKRIGWMTQALQALGPFLACLNSKPPPATLGFLYRLMSAYATGAIAASKLTPAVAEKLLGTLREQLLSRGAVAADMPEWKP